MQRAIRTDREMTTSNRIPVLTPQGHLVLAPTDEARTLPDNIPEHPKPAFERGAGHGLLELGIREVGTALPVDFAYWRDFAARYVATLCASARPPRPRAPVAVSIIETPAGRKILHGVVGTPRRLCPTGQENL